MTRLASFVGRYVGALNWDRDRAYRLARTESLEDELLRILGRFADLLGEPLEAQQWASAAENAAAAIALGHELAFAWGVASMSLVHRLSDRLEAGSRQEWSYRSLMNAASALRRRRSHIEAVLGSSVVDAVVVSNDASVVTLQMRRETANSSADVTSSWSFRVFDEPATAGIVLDLGGPRFPSPGRQCFGGPGGTLPWRPSLGQAVQLQSWLDEVATSGHCLGRVVRSEPGGIEISVEHLAMSAADPVAMWSVRPAIATVPADVPAHAARPVARSRVLPRSRR